MKLIIDSSIALKWYVSDAETVKALRLRFDFHRGIHELLAPDNFSVDCGGRLLRAERQKVISVGETRRQLNDLSKVGVLQHAAWPLMQRAAAIALLTRLTIADGLYVALAEREGCTMITAEQKLLRKTHKQFPFVIAFASLP